MMKMVLTYGVVNVVFGSVRVVFARPWGIVTLSLTSFQTPWHAQPHRGSDPWYSRSSWPCHGGSMDSQASLSSYLARSNAVFGCAGHMLCAGHS